jgi:peptidoglycan hydrolase-like protein with peptidoglycan-binding domain
MLLELGAKGDAVRRLQILLNDNLRPGPQLRVDAHFGVKTENAVMKFRELRKLAADGVVGAQTWAALGQRETHARQRRR